MNNKVILLLAILFMLAFSSSYSQDSCKVLKPEISAKYQGKCKKGLAQGKGVAEGIDKYEGDFYKGLPDGIGKYTWANGNIYTGEWKAGKRNGEGYFKYKVNGTDSTNYGLWENDIFVKKIISSPYKVYSVRDVDRYSVSKTGDGDKITLRLIRLGKDNLNVSNLDFFADNGSYKEVGKNYIYENVKFPVVLKINYVTSGKLELGVSGGGRDAVSGTGGTNITVVFEVTINEPGDWRITLNN